MLFSGGKPFDRTVNLHSVEDSFVINTELIIPPKIKISFLICSCSPVDPSVLAPLQSDPRIRFLSPLHPG